MCRRHERGGEGRDHRYKGTETTVPGRSTYQGLVQGLVSHKGE